MYYQIAYIPSGLCVGDRIVWLKDDHPEIGTVRWIGKIRMQFYAGIEFVSLQPLKN